MVVALALFLVVCRKSAGTGGGRKDVNNNHDDRNQPPPGYRRSSPPARHATSVQSTPASSGVVGRVAAESNERAGARETIDTDTNPAPCEDAHAPLPCSMVAGCISDTNARHTHTLGAEDMGLKHAPAPTSTPSWRVLKMIGRETTVTTAPWTRPAPRQCG